MAAVVRRVCDAVHATTRRGLLTLAALSLVATGRAAGQVSVDEAELFLNPGSGKTVGSFNVTNEGTGTAQVTIYMLDWDRQENGEHRFLPSGQLPNSCSPYLQVFPQSLRLPPGGRQAVRVGLTGADSLRAACWSIAFVETSTLQSGSGRQITYVTRLGVKIYVLPSGLAKDGTVEDIVVQPGDSGRRQIAIAFRASGGLPVWVRGTIEYRRPDNTIALTDSVPEFPVLPGALRRVTVPVPPLARGSYVALALLDYGGAEIAAGQVPVRVP
jgi:P pilus assembly chaperone PapD